MTTSVPQVEPFVFMNWNTLQQLRRTHDEDECWPALKTLRSAGRPKYARYKGKRVITCALLEDGVITETITRPQAMWIVSRFNQNGWPTPREVMDVAIGLVGEPAS